MLLYLVQHGEARKEEEDPERGLTEKGAADVRRVAAHALTMNLRVSQIFHSGKTRAMQTAQMFAEHLKPEKDLSQTDNLAPMDEPEVWARRLGGITEDIMLVGHLPFLAKLAGLLLCGDKGMMFIGFKMGGIVCLRRFEDGHWAVEWMVVPEMVN